LGRLREAEDRVDVLEKEVRRLREVEVKHLRSLLEHQEVEGLVRSRTESGEEVGCKEEAMELCTTPPEEGGGEVKEEWLEPFKRGWRREVLVQGSRVTNIRYLAPEGRARVGPGWRGEAVSRKNLVTFLANTKASTGLNKGNFNLTRKVVGFGEGREVIRRSLGRPSVMYKDYITEKPGSSLVTCKLCNKDTPRGQFSKHMRQNHLPEEDCERCGEEFPAMDIARHRRSCRGLGPPTRTSQDMEASQGTLMGDVPSLTDNIALSPEKKAVVDTVSISSEEDDGIKITPMEDEEVTKLMDDENIWQQSKKDIGKEKEVISDKKVVIKMKFGRKGLLVKYLPNLTGSSLPQNCNTGAGP